MWPPPPAPPPPPPPRPPPPPGPPPAPPPGGPGPGPPPPRGPGFSLEEIARLLPSGDGAWQHGELLEGLRRKVAEIEALQRRLEQNKAQLLVAIESIENKPDGLQCTENTQRVLERLREEGPPQTVGRPRQTRSRASSPTPAEQRLSDA
ncbi:MerR family DNA-binding protein [Pseudomonas aeruginosa]|uniref:MerR family DNA-binding protein n=1 Tax=Pseudomonas aeruginosa TaxID=287 RepID=UPI0021F1C37C|nr:MerR family DNA-binding protein [Pseudomonas aeruginosa]MCV4349827.1 MerR family DNA-binding protein [Pseudomonas aeruginosa]